MTLRSAARSLRARKRAFDDSVKSLAWWVGWFGMGLLALNGLLWLVPHSVWDGVLGLRAERLPVYTMVAMLLASLVGWLYVNKGEDRIKKRLGRHVNLALFVVLPLACMAAGLLQEWLTRQTGWQPPGHPFWLFVHWYPSLLVITCATVFLAWKSRPRKHVYLDRGLGYTLLFLPYGLLFAFLVLRVRLDFVGDSMQETMAAMGRYALVIQLVIAYFIGGD